MDNIINIGTFIQQLTYYIKLAIFINKGTDDETVLDKCIKLYNKYKSIEVSNEISKKDEIFVRKCLKRLNLILKLDEEGKPIDIRIKENQLKMVYLKNHPALATGTLNEMIEYATTNNIDILTSIPLMFMLRESKYQDILWQYTRSLFYISQLLISKNIPDKPDTMKQAIYDDAALHLEEILTTISVLEENHKISQQMALDAFLSRKLIKTTITMASVKEAKNEVKELFEKKGISKDNSMMKMIDMISDQLTTVDLTKGTIIQSMVGIAKNVANEMKDQLESPEKFQGTLGAITEIFQEAMDDSSKSGEEIPAEIKNAFGTILSMAPLYNNNNDGSQPSEQDIEKGLAGIISANGLDRNEFFASIKDANGEVDISKLEHYLANIKPE